MITANDYSVFWVCSIEIRLKFALKDIVILADNINYIDTRRARKLKTKI